MPRDLRPSLMVRHLALLGLVWLTFCSCQANLATTGSDLLLCMAPLPTKVQQPDSVEKSEDAKSNRSEPAPEMTAAAKKPKTKKTGKSSAKSATVKPKESKTTEARVKREYPLQPNPLAGCSLCHVDVEDEYVDTTHFEESVGCKTCHGPSKGHLADENNEVKPDEMFARKDVDRLCAECHECDRPEPTKTARGKDKKLLVCIDCHGHHDQKPAGKTETPKAPKQSS